MDTLLNGAQWLLYDAGLAPWIWGMWCLLALPLGHLLASAIEDPEEVAATVGAVAAMSGVGSLMSGGGFLKGASETLDGLFWGGVLVVGVPTVYTLPVALRVGAALDLDLLGALAWLLVGVGLLFALHAALWAAAARRAAARSALLGACLPVVLLSLPSWGCFLAR